MFTAGCSSAGNTPAPESTSTATSLAAEVPIGYNPCTDVPAAVMAAERQESTGRADADAPNGVKWRGCGWVMNTGSGYGVRIRTTNLTLSMVRDRNLPDTHEFVIESRQAVSTRRENDDTGCWVNVEMKGGTLEFLIDNPKSNKDTGQIDACQIAKDLAVKVVPSIPASA
ncbi:DUF3558 domain-containing protein [Nocardia sp. NPDC058666]|uniref:DUF3558 domain-containing protein n=1 Tax=Nocardia sp. NPDC058666 TaxID=3346587 RepID=UPI00366415CF